MDGCEYDVRLNSFSIRAQTQLINQSISINTIDFIQNFPLDDKLFLEQPILRGYMDGRTDGRRRYKLYHFCFLSISFPTTCYYTFA